MHKKRLSHRRIVARLAAALVVCLAPGFAGCSVLFGYSLELRGGWDAPAGQSAPIPAPSGDRIYFVAERIEGIGSGLCALEVAPGWKDQSKEPTRPGFAALVEPVDVRWIHREEDMPEADPGRFNGWANSPYYEGDPPLVVLSQDPSSREDRVFESPDPYAYEKVRAALKKGGDAYVLVRKGRYLKYGFDLYGATGPPVTWVHLGFVEVSSGEGPVAYGLARSLGAVGYALDAGYVAAMTLVVGVGLGPLGGAVIFTEPLGSMYPETPW